MCMPTWVYIVSAVKNGQIVEHIKEYTDFERALSKLRLLNRLYYNDSWAEYGETFVILARRK
jgi:hypothetical protein